MQNITPLVSAVEKAVAAHQAVLDEAQAKATAERAALAASQEAANAALAPVHEARANLNNRLIELTSKRAGLLEEIRIGRHQMVGQQNIAGDFRGIATGNFGNEYAEKNAGIFISLLENRPHGILALLVIPWLETWLTEKEEALNETENQIAELAKSAKSPVK